MKKVIKIAIIALIAIVAVVLALPLWIGPVAKGVANAVVPGKTGTSFDLGEFGLNPYSGSLHVGKMVLGNPEGFEKEPKAVDLGSFDVKVSVSEIIGGKVHVESVDLDGLFVYSSGAAENFMKIAENATGGKDESQAKEDVKEEAKTEEGEKKGGVVIDVIRIKNVKIKWGLVVIPVPSIELKDIGKDKPEGASWTDVWNDIFNAVMKGAGKLGDLGLGVLDLGKDGAAAASEAAGKAVGAAGEAVGNAADAAGEAAGKAATAAGEAAGKAATAVGESAGKAVDAMKSLFK